MSLYNMKTVAESASSDHVAGTKYPDNATWHLQDFGLFPPKMQAEYLPNTTSLLQPLDGVLSSTEVHVTPSASEVEMAIEKLERHKSPGTDQSPAELIKAGGRIILFQIHKLIISIWNKEETWLDNAGKNQSCWKHTALSF
jgi:hypothetical protein